MSCPILCWCIRFILGAGVEEDGAGQIIHWTIKLKCCGFQMKCYLSSNCPFSNSLLTFTTSLSFSLLTRYTINKQTNKRLEELFLWTKTDNLRKLLHTYQKILLTTIVRHLENTKFMKGLVLEIFILQNKYSALKEWIDIWMWVHMVIWKDLKDISWKSTKLQNTTNIMIPFNLTKHIHIGVCVNKCTGKKKS